MGVSVAASEVIVCPRHFEEGHIILSGRDILAALMALLRDKGMLRYTSLDCQLCRLLTRHSLTPLPSS